jgi:hypothetical protein
MALTDISSNGVGVLEFSRGNIGTLVDISSIKGIFEIPSGGGAGSVFPIEDDVRIGITYGPTGADNTGNLTLPDEIDVLLGVLYGAGGTEFIGSLSGGGGFIYIDCE